MNSTPAASAEPTQLDRIEMKLDAVLGILAALAEEDGLDDDEPTHDLHGNPLQPSRDQNETL